MEQFPSWIPLVVSVLNLTTALIGWTTARSRRPRTPIHQQPPTPAPPPSTPETRRPARGGGRDDGSTAGGRDGMA
ncbi:hypothetical protein AB0J63_49185 [Streptosporangium canum]|uniref:hypothetical protein n=1 Tax=Streptosporangium canum TaxID=324952 RepID=UPI00343273F2